MEKIKKIFSYTLPFILMVLFLYMAFKNVNFDDVFKIVSNMSIVWFGAYILIWFFSHLVRAFRWKTIISSVKNDTNVLNLFGAIMVGYGVNCVVPRLGEVYRGLFLGKWEDISRSSMVGTIIIERVIDILVLGFSVLVSVAIFPGDLFTEVTWLKSTIGLGFLAIFGLIFFLYLLVKLKDRFIDIITKLVSKFSSKLAEGLSRIFHLLIDGFSSLKGTKNFILVVFHSILIMLLYGLTAYVGFYILHMQDIQSVSFAMAWIVMTISAFGVIIPTPGATGSYHLIVMFVLINIYGFNEEISGAYALITHTTTYILFIASTLLLTYFINKRQVIKGLPHANFISVFKTKSSLI